MVKKPVKGNGTTKIRFIMLEAEMPEGDLTQITNAIQNALRPVSVNGPRQFGRPVDLVSADNGVEDDDAVVDNADDYEEVEAQPKAKAPSKARRPAKRNVVGMDLTSDVSLKAYAEQYPPKTDQDRFLVALMFLKEHRPNVDEITGDHLFTCFKSMGWPCGAKDFTQPLRTLKRDQLVDGGKSRGTYVINHVGEGRAKKLAEG
ncbi:MAG: hypothetical protein C0524_14880 [Rhodobacter sp.]|nr:hypothetical protein [Rhodobacter sp.]